LGGIGGSVELPPMFYQNHAPPSARPYPPGAIAERRAPPIVRLLYSPDVPTQPVSDTSTVTPSGAVYFTSTLAYRWPACPTPNA
jgi:hypothetical protein